MAKHSMSFSGNYKSILERIDSAILDGSFSASYEDGVLCSEDGYVSAMRVYERYSYTGGNRVSMSVFLLGKDNRYTVTFITSGGSQATFFKLNTIGEEAFLDTVVSALDDLK